MIQIKVNHENYQVDVPADMPLLWVLREFISLPGTKYGCGIGQCGSCTVLVDGKARRACQLKISELPGREVMTIEGLAQDEVLHPLQKAWVEEDVPQCGYCQSGQIMTALALLGENPQPDDAAIDRALRGNICRCGTYTRIRKAIKKAAQSLKDE
ncbi:MAG: (2Fe-2S)-binding protein [Bacteroidota bacterium]